VKQRSMDMTQSKDIKWNDQYASKGVDERVWAVQPVEHAGTKVTK
jgi:hypothetical protein